MNPLSTLFGASMPGSAGMPGSRALRLVGFGGLDAMPVLADPSNSCGGDCGCEGCADSVGPTFGSFFAAGLEALWEASPRTLFGASLGAESPHTLEGDAGRMIAPCEGTACPCDPLGECCTAPVVIRGDIADIEDGVNITVSGCPEALTELLIRAWGMLEANTDIVDWAECLVFGDRLDFVVSDFLHPFSTLIPVEVVGTRSIMILDENTPAWFDKKEGCSPQGTIMQAWWLSQIQLCLLNNIPIRWERVWRCGSEAARTCVLVDAAATLAHELTHVSNMMGKHTFGSCDQGFLFENVVRWALTQRFSETKSADCCSAFNDSIFMKAKSIVIASGCREECATGGAGGGDGGSSGGSGTRWDPWTWGVYNSLMEHLYDPAVYVDGVRVYDHPAIYPDPSHDGPLPRP